MLTLAVVIVWAAAAYRMMISWSLPTTLWRSTFTAVMILNAVALTVYRWRVQIDALFDALNLAGLLSRSASVIALGCTLVYLHSLRAERVPGLALGTYAALTVAVMSVLVVTWTVGPFHERELDDLVAVRPAAAVGVYLLTFWAYLGVGLAMTGLTCLRRRRSLRHRDRVREISLLCSASGAVVGVVVMILWSASFVLEEARVDGGPVNHAGDLLMPLSAGLIGIGVVSLLVLPYFADLHAARRTCRQLRPVWLAMIAEYPQLHLEPRSLGGGPLSRSQFRLERMIIEILDVLRLAPVVTPSPGTSAYDAVMRSVCSRDTSGPLRAEEVLEPARTREDELEQLLGLAQAHERLQHAPT